MKKAPDDLQKSNSDSNTKTTNHTMNILSVNKPFI